MTPNTPHWTIYTCPQVDEPEALCDFRATSSNFNYIFARACHIKVVEFEKRVFIRRTEVKPFNQDQRFLEDVSQLEVMSLLTFVGLDELPGIPTDPADLEYPF